MPNPQVIAEPVGPSPAARVDSRGSAAGLTPGTPAHMAPELALVEAFDGRPDLRHGIVAGTRGSRGRAVGGKAGRGAEWWKMNRPA